MDLNIYYADPEARQEEVVINFLKNLHAWFDDKMRKVQNDIKSNLERNNQTVCVMKNVEDQDGKPLSVPQYPLRLAHIPYFVVITVPELGDWEVFFQGLNDRLRQFVTANKRNFTLLDWANILKKMKPDDVSTVEKRTAVLIREMHYEHGVLYH
uniref:TIR domain-containing protein n=1 Tax=Meloidogyne hapla TaxID=6305 RepID=A0A1I8B539_MELHA